MKKYAFLLLDPYADVEKHRFCYETPGREIHLRTVNSMAQARDTIRALQAEGFGAVELCGAFGEFGAQELLELTGGTLPIGYVVHKPEQEALFDAFFSAK